MSDAGAHRRQVAEVFNRSAADYDAEGHALFPRFARRLVEAAGVAPDQAVLDVATGTGQVLLAAAEAVGPGGRVVGIDLSEGMLDHARAAISARGLAQAEVRVMDAEQLDFPDATFDRVLCGFGLSFMPDSTAALRQFYRVLRPGGVVGATTFRAQPTMAWLKELMESFGVAGDGLVTRPLTNPDVLAAVFTEAGFAAVEVVAEDESRLYADEDAWWRARWLGASRAGMEAMDEPTRERFRVVAYEGLQAHRTPVGFRLPSTVLIVTARRTS